MSSRLRSSVGRLRANVYARATAWIVFGQFFDRFLALLNNIAIARLLSPEILGVIAIINAVNQGATLFSEIGINQNIVRSKNGENPIFYNTAWTIQVVRGIVLFILICIFAYPLAKFFEIEELIVLFPVAGIGFILSGFISTSFATLERRFFQRRLVISLLISQMIGIVVLVAYALYSPTVWALIFGILAQHAARLVISHNILEDISNKIRFDVKSFVEIFKFGKWIFFIGIFTYLARQIDIIIFAKLMPIAVLGVYSVSKLLVLSVAMLAHKFGAGVILPFYSKLSRSENSDQDIAAERNIYFFTLAFSCVLIAFFASFGDIAVDIIYGSRYSEAGWMFSLLCGGLWFLVLSGVISSRFIGEGRPAAVLFGLVCKLGVFVSCVFVMYGRFGMLGAIMAVNLSHLTGYVAIAAARGEFGSRHFRHELAFTLMFFLLAVAMNYGRLIAGLDTSIAEVMP